MTLRNTKSGEKPLFAEILLICLCLVGFLALAPSPTHAQDLGASQSGNELAPAETPAESDSNSIASLIYKILIAIALALVAFVALIMSPILPMFQSKLEPEVIVEHKGENSGSTGKKVLVAYFTRHGTAASIANRIYETLCQKGFAADMRFIGNIPRDEDLSGYDAFVIGSAVYWAMAKDFIDFVSDHKETLVQKPTAVFSCCLTIQRETPKNLERVAAYIETGLKHVPELQPIDKVAFAGKVEMPKLTFPEKAFLWFLFTVTPQRGGDHRDWNKITAWAEKVAAQI